MNIDIHLCVAISYAAVLVASLIAFVWQPRRQGDPKKANGGGLILVGGALALLLTIVYGLTNNPVAARYSTFYQAVAYVLLLVGSISASATRSQPKDM